MYQFMEIMVGEAARTVWYSLMVMVTAAIQETISFSMWKLVLVRIGVPILLTTRAENESFVEPWVKVV